MTSLLTTMFVSLFSSRWLLPSNSIISSPSKPLPPQCSPQQSSSCVTVNSYTAYDTPEPEEDVLYPSPGAGRAAKMLREELRYSNGYPRTPQNTLKTLFSGSNADIVSCSNARTRQQFKPQRTNKGTTSYQLRQFAEATLGSGSLRKAVKLPEGEDLNEWLAVNGRRDNYLRYGVEAIVAKFLQSSISTIKSTCCTARSRNSAPHSHVRR